jgi:hypothetical protein
MASNFAVPSAPSTKRAIKKQPSKITVLRSSSSATNIMESRAGRKQRSSVCYDKENTPPINMLAQSLELAKIDGKPITDHHNTTQDRLCVTSEILRPAPQMPAQHTSFLSSSQPVIPPLALDMPPPQLQIIKSPRLNDCRSISSDTVRALFRGIGSWRRFGTYLPYPMYAACKLDALSREGNVI